MNKSRDIEELEGIYAGVSKILVNLKFCSQVQILGVVQRISLYSTAEILSNSHERCDNFSTRSISSRASYAIKIAILKCFWSAALICSMTGMVKQILQNLTCFEVIGCLFIELLYSAVEFAFDY